MMLPTSSPRQGPGGGEESRLVTTIYVAEITFHAHMTFISERTVFYDRSCICLFAIATVH